MTGRQFLDAFDEGMKEVRRMHDEGVLPKSGRVDVEQVVEARLIPELDVSDLTTSLEFYAGLVGFNVLFDRPEERFAFLDLSGARLMLEEAEGPGRRFRTAALEAPFGRGVNLQIEVQDVETLYQRLKSGGHQLLIPLEDRWYRREGYERGNRQFVVADPDGYLLRFFSSLGVR